MVFTLSGMLPAWNVTYFERASEKIKDAIQIASEDGIITEIVPQNVLTYFNRFGKKLKKDEVIQFRPSFPEKKAEFTRSTRRKLISASTTSGEYTEVISIKGILSEMDKSKSSFIIETPYRKKYSGAFSEETKDLFLQAFSASDGNQKVMIEGIGLFSNSSKLKEINQVENLILLDEFDLSYRLDQLAQLKDGWYEGEGIALDTEALKWFGDSYKEYIYLDNKVTYAFPTPEGKLQLEWTSHSYEIEFLVDLQAKNGILSVFDLTTNDKDNDDILDLSDENTWVELNNRLKEILTLA